MKADPALGVRDVDRRPVVVRERVPDRVVVVDRDRVFDAQGVGFGGHVVEVVLEAELGRVGADDGQAVIRVLPVPRPEIGECSKPIDAGVGPEVHEDDAPSQSLGRHRIRVQPGGRAVEPGQVSFDGQGR